MSIDVAVDLKWGPVEINDDWTHYTTCHNENLAKCGLDLSQYQWAPVIDHYPAPEDCPMCVLVEELHLPCPPGPELCECDLG